MFWVIWALTVVVLGLRAPMMAALSIGGAVYAMLLIAASVRFLPPSIEARNDDVLRDPPDPASRARLGRLLISSGSLALVILVSFAYGGTSPRGVYIAWLTPHLVHLASIPSSLGNGLTPLFNFGYLAVVPGILLLSFGASRRTLGLIAWRPRTSKVLVLCLLVPTVMALVSLWNGRVTLTVLLMMLVHNMLSNGFSEEFFARAVILSQLRAWLSNECALVVQAMLFAALHFGGSMADDSSRLVVLAMAIGLNAPAGLALGVLALRSRSLALPSIVHISLDTMGSLVGAR